MKKTSKDVASVAAKLAKLTPEHVKFLVSLAEDDPEVLELWVDNVQSVAGSALSQKE